MVKYPTNLLKVLAPSVGTRTPSFNDKVESLKLRSKLETIMSGEQIDLTALSNGELLRKTLVKDLGHLLAQVDTLDLDDLKSVTHIEVQLQETLSTVRSVTDTLRRGYNTREDLIDLVKQGTGRNQRNTDTLKAATKTTDPTAVANEESE